jgi:hypothetical protein
LASDASWKDAAVTSEIAPWPWRAFRPTGRRATVTLIAFADDNVIGSGLDFELRDAVPPGAPVDALDVRRHTSADSAAWIDGFRKGGLRNIASHQLGDLDRLDSASSCYSISISVEDPADLTYLQLAWAVASRIAAGGAIAVLDVLAVNWLAGSAAAALSPRRPFVIQREISIIAETETTPGFGHAVHTRGMIKFGSPDLVAGVAADRIEHTGRILNHLASMLADGHDLVCGQQLRFDGQRLLTVATYTPDATTPNLELNNDALLLVDV